MEARFAKLIWDHEPVGSGELVRLAWEELGWKKSTTYTVLRRLCQRGIFQNEGGAVTSRMTKEEFDALQSEQFVDSAFSGSLPAFLAAFTTRKKLSEEEVQELQDLIDQSRKG
jgi:predicted transcriptional regulator